jgi:hypothetical protein
MDGPTNRERGDLLLPSGRTVEVKRLGIDPGNEKFGGRTLVELGMFRGLLRSTDCDGLAHLARVADSSLRALRSLKYAWGTEDHAPGVIAHSELACSLDSQLGATLLMQANPDNGFLYVLTPAELRQRLIETARGLHPLVRGPGRASENTLLVYVPLPMWRWRRTSGVWRYVGDGDAALALGCVRALLGASEPKVAA